MNYEDIEACMMVDTLGLCVHDADPARLRDKFMKIDGDDGAQWSKGSLVTAAGKQALKVRAVKSKREYRIETSPAFLRQGHNIISSGDLPMLAFAAIQESNRDLKFGFSLKHAAEFVRGRGMDVTRVDTPVLLAKPTGLQTSAVINGLALAGLLAGNNTSVYINESVYFDQHSQLAALKLYDKAAEVASRTRLKIPVTPNTPRLMLLAHETIRLEAVYRQKWLKRRFSEGGPLTPARLTPNVLAGMLLSLLDNYDLKRDIRKPLNEEQLMAIPGRFRPWAMYWQHGQDVLKMMDNNKVEYSRAHSYLDVNHSINIYAMPPVELGERVELGEILSPSNFVAPPEVLKQDAQLYFTCDLSVMQKEIDGKIALETTSSEHP